MHPFAAGAVLTTPGTAPFSLFVGPTDVIPGVPLDSIHFEDNGAGEVGQLEFDVVDMALATVIGDAARVRFEENLAAGLQTDFAGTALLGRTWWIGEVIARKPTINAFGRVIHVTAHHVTAFLDLTLVPADYRRNSTTAYDTVGSESDQQRIMYLLAIYGAQLPSRAADQIALIAAFDSLLPQRYQGLTLRQAAEAVLAQASVNATYYVDGPGRLHTLEGLAGDLGAAPYAIRIGTPGLGEIAPEDLEIEWDSSNLVNAYYVKGATDAGSGWVVDAASVQKFGRHEDYIDAPDADTSAKRDAIGSAALADTSNPVPRGSFTAKSPYDGWAAGQTLTINSAPQHDINAPVTYRIVTVETTFLSGAGDREYAVSFGAPRADLDRVM